MDPQSIIRFPAGCENQALDDQQLIDRAAHLFRLHGSLMLENSFDTKLVDTLQSDFLTHYANTDMEEVEKNCLKVGIGRYMFTIRLQAPYMNPGLYAAPKVLPIVKALLGDDCIIQSVGVVCAYPGSKMQHVHRDHPPLFAEAGGLNAFFPPYALHVVVPLVDLTEQTGTTAMWEGSHRIKSRAEETRWSKQELEQLKGAVTPWPKVGDCYFMDFRLRHTGMPNLSDSPRPILYLVFSRKWFQDRRNYEKQSPLLLSEAEFGKTPDEYRHLFENALQTN